MINRIDLSFILISIDVQFKKLEGEYCMGPYEYFDNLTDAKESCANDRLCEGVWDYRCDDGFSYLCKIGFDYIKDIGHCIYDKKGKI